MWPQMNIRQWTLMLIALVIWVQIGCDSQFQEYTALGEGDMALSEPLSQLHAKQMKRTKHQAVRVCRQCHASGSSLRARRFVKPIPELCYDCHEDRRPSGPYVHGPVAVGACLFCHRPHVSTYAHLLKVSQPRLCTRCHDKENYPLSEIHHTVSDQLCTDCHDPHGSTHPLFLKKEP